MKKIICFIMILQAIVIVVSGCEKRQESEEWAGIEIDPDFKMTDEGCFWEGNGSNLLFFDFKSKQTVVLCTKPGCTHEDKNCAAYIDGMILYTKTNIYYVRNIDVEQGYALYQRDKDNSSEVKVATLLVDEVKKGNSYQIGDIYYNDNYMYYSANIYTSQDDMYTDEVELHPYSGIWRMNLTTGEETVIIPPANQHLDPVLVKDDGLIFIEMKFPMDSVSFEDTDQLESEEVKKSTEWNYKIWNEETGEVQELYESNYYNPTVLLEVIDNKGYVFQRNENKTEVVFRTFDLDTKTFDSEEKIFSYEQMKKLNNGYIALNNGSKSNEDVCLYNYLTEETVYLKGKTDRFIEVVTPGGFIFYKFYENQENRGRWVYIDKEDEMAGKGNYIEMEIKEAD